MIRSTYTYALVEVSKATFEEIASKLKESGIYDHAFHDDGKVIDMHGLALKVTPEPEKIDPVKALENEGSWHDPE